MESIYGLGVWIWSGEKYWGAEGVAGMGCNQPPMISHTSSQAKIREENFTLPDLFFTT